MGLQTLARCTTRKQQLKRFELDITYHIKSLRRKVQEFQLMQQIKKKWIADALLLPLTSEHWELYVIIHKLCHKELGEFPNLVDCRDFNDRIQWLKLFDQDEEIIRCSDKVLVREHVREKVGNDFLLNLYQVHDHFEQIDFDSLPDSFVIKTNHDSGTVILIRDKCCFDKAAASARTENSLKRVYGRSNGEWAYSFIRPKVLVEEYIDSGSHHPPADYKFHCVDGRVLWLQYIYDRGSNTKECIVSLDGCVTSLHFDRNMHHSEDFKKPAVWEQMLNCAGALSKGFKYVRVDLFENDGRVYVGEMTFFPLMGCYLGADQKQLGSLLDFDRTTFKSPVLCRMMSQLY